MTRTITSRIGLGLASGALAAAALASQASAAPSDTAPDPSGDRAGLTSAERAQLDSEVAETLRDTQGGKRIGPNQIAWPNKGAVMTIPLPGEKRARVAGKPTGDRGSACNYKHACVFDGSGYTGRRISFYNCGFQKLRWFDFTNKTSSWINNQTEGTRATLYYWDGEDVRNMTSLVAEAGQSWLYPDDNRADFIRAC